MRGRVSDPSRCVAAPGLSETARIWFDSDAEPVVTWDADATRFLLVEDGGRRVLIDGP